jgi:hypothetical protein
MNLMIDDLKRDFKLEVGGDVSAFLGVLVEKRTDGSFKLTQRGL